MASQMDTGVMQVGNGEEPPLLCHDSKCPMESRIASLEQLVASQSALISSLSSQLATQNMENVALKSKMDSLSEEVELLKQQQDKEQSVKGVKLLFNFDKIRKKDVFVWIIEMIEKKGFESTIEKLIEFLAIFTNLGSKDTIRTQLYDYKRHF